MSDVLKAFLGLFMILFLVFSSVSIIDASFQANQARDYISAAVSEFENSGHSMNVMNECGSAAVGNGYEMEVRLYFEDGKNQLLVYKEEADRYEKNTSEAVMSEVILRYPYTLGFFGVTKMHEIRCVT